MTQPSRKVEGLVWFGLGLIVATILVIFLLAKLNRGGEEKPLPVYGTVADFQLTNQNGQAVSLATLRGHVWVADIIFTRCPGPCTRMTKQLSELEQALPGTNTRFVSLTTDPEYDSPEVLQKYAERLGVNTRRWQFLTGSKEQISKLAIDSLKLTVVEKKPEERESPQDLFIHSTIFVLVDKQGQLRGVFETMGEGIDPARVKDQLIAAVKNLETQK